MLRVFGDPNDANVHVFHTCQGQILQKIKVHCPFFMRCALVAMMQRNFIECGNIECIERMT